VYVVLFKRKPRSPWEADFATHRTKEAAKARATDLMTAHFKAIVRWVEEVD
jgi:hypothetical protein